MLCVTQEVPGIVCNTEGPRFDPPLKCFFHIATYVGNSKNSDFSFLTCYRDAYGYIKMVWIVDNAINVTRHAKTGHICINYTCSENSTFLRTSLFMINKPVL